MTHVTFNLAEFVRKYDVHPEAKSYLQNHVDNNIKPYYELGTTGARNARLKEAEMYAGTTEFNGTEKEFIVPSPYFTDGIPVSVYRPQSCDQIKAPPIVVYLHGGGNTVGSRKTHATTCKILARDACCLFVNVEYRLAPEHRFPASNNDAKCTVRWITMNKTLIGAQNSSPLGVAGDSAGGKLAAVISHELSDIIQFSILVYTSFGYTTRYPSSIEFEHALTLSKIEREWFVRQYISPEEYTNPKASPILNKNFSHLPPTLLIVAELDPLRDSMYAYYDKLKDAGVHVEELTLKGVTHGFWALPGHFKECCNQAYEKAVSFISAHSNPL